MSSAPVMICEPYSFGYDNVDEFGTKTYHKEQGDASNAKTGSFGYTDASGLFRRVNYVADAGGFRAKIDTNEPRNAARSERRRRLQLQPSSGRWRPLFVSVHGGIHLRRIRLRPPGPLGWLKETTEFIVTKLSPCTRLQSVPVFLLNKGAGGIANMRNS
ncbi:hypothetical protein HPB48_022126 [Haemaphysalis longicornis]|uniref:Cuticle protein n=1 Tax=Haemaphysalis longicornis TaxID=44386 RepID=A0A9J6G8F3_HAELO|nr:hypothetical protein HPB48_022126 [Haemaphysalis longicornis]